MKKRTRFTLVLCVLGICGVGGYMTYSYAMNLIGNKIANQLVMEAAKNQHVLENIELPVMKEAKGVILPKTAQVSSSEPIASDKDKQEGSSKAANSNQGQDESKSVPGKQDQQAASNDGEKPAVTEKRDALSFSNKQEAIKFVMSRFSISEINRLRQMTSGGLTPENKSELKKIAYAKFTPTEIAAVQRVVSSQ